MILINFQMSDPDSFHPSPKVLQSGNEFFMQYPRDSLIWKILSRLLVFLSGVIAKLFITLWHTTEVLNTEAYFSVMEQAARENRGVITVMNHISSHDDPLVWGGTLPLRVMLSARTRWTLAARDVVFRSEREQVFYSLGQVLGTQRFGKGPDQPALDAAISLLSQGKWVHLFPEGFVHQPYEPFSDTLRYFRWGVSRLILESGPKMPIVLPIYGKGLDEVFPEDKASRAFGYGSKRRIVYAFGDPIDPAKLGEMRVDWQGLNLELEAAKDKEPIKAKMNQLRSKAACFVREGVLKTKQQYFGKSDYDSDQRFSEPLFWKGDLVRTKGKTIAEKFEASKIVAARFEATKAATEKCEAIRSNLMDISNACVPCPEH